MLECLMANYSVRATLVACDTDTSDSQVCFSLLPLTINMPREVDSGALAVELGEGGRKP